MKFFKRSFSSEVFHNYSLEPQNNLNYCHDQVSGLLNKWNSKGYTKGSHYKNGSAWATDLHDTDLCSGCGTDNYGFGETVSVKKLTSSDKERIKIDITEINNYLSKKYQNYKNSKIEVKYNYLKKGDKLLPVYFMNINLGNGSKKLFRFLPISNFNGIDSIDKSLNSLSSSKYEERGDTK